MPKISVIIPTYNRAKYLTKCLDSIFCQTLRDIEVILVDDGSTDNTEGIVRKYYDKRLKYYKRTNHGIGSSRNFGIDNAIGDYICFVDSDDYISSDCLEKMYNKAIFEKLDFVICDFYNFYEDGTKEQIHLKDFDNTSLIKTPSLICDINLGPCNKLMKRSIINNYRFPEDIKYEDMPFVVEVLKNAKNIGKVNEPLNYFLMDNKSETTVRDKKIFDIFKSLDLVIETLSENEFDESLKELVISKIVNYTIQQRYIKDKKVRDKFIDEAFIYIEKIDKNYKKNIYFKKRNVFKSIIEKNKLLTKIYCDIYTKLK